VIPADVTDESAVREMVETTVEEFGRLDVLVNNAGVMLLEPVAEADPDNWRQLFEVNVLGRMTASQAAADVMEEQGSGDVVNVSSVADRKAYACSSGYNASKLGVNGFSVALREEFVETDVRVTMIGPGVVDAELPEHIPTRTGRRRSSR
jgi:NADP-dependent 3-hydroxy acid dehydrogenase YdfG